MSRFKRGVPDDRKIWSATAVVNEQYHPTLKRVHRSFLEAGSDAVTTNSYGITPGVGFSPDDIGRYVAVAGRLARESVDDGDTDSVVDDDDDAITAQRRPGKFVCGSLGPLVESYRPDRVMDHPKGVDMYGVMARALAPHVDCFLAETMSSVEEASQAVEAVGKLSTKEKYAMMVSFTLKGDGAIRSGELSTDGVRRIVQISRDCGVNLLGVMFNCAEPEAITKAFETIRSDKPTCELLLEERVMLGAYANRLTAIASDWSLDGSEEPQAMRSDLSPQEYFHRFIRVWVNDLGVQMVGGCCGITPEHISYMNSHLKSKQ